jgi:hypothetical protein
MVAGYNLAVYDTLEVDHKLSMSINGSCHLSTTKGTFPFSRVLLD